MYYHCATMKSILQFKMTVNHNVLYKLRLYYNHALNSSWYYFVLKPLHDGVLVLCFCLLFLSMGYRYMLSPNRRRCQTSRQKYRKFGWFSSGAKKLCNTGNMSLFQPYFFKKIAKQGKKKKDRRLEIKWTSNKM